MSHFAADDHLRHAPDATGRMRDSLFWQSVIGEESLCFQAYLYLTAAGTAGFNVALWGGKDEGFRAVDFVQDNIAATMDLDDFRFAGLHLRSSGVGEPVQIDYAGKRVQFSLSFSGLHPPFSYHANPDGLPSWFAMNRYEQTGRITGHIEARGRRIEIDRIGHRDHSWGNRDWGMPQHWKWFVAYTADGSIMLNGWFWIARGEYGCAGYVVRDGKLAAIAHMRPHATYDPDMSQRSLSVEIHDVDRRITPLEMQRFGILKLPSNDKLGTVIQEAGCHAQIAGIAGSGQFETHWQQGYIDHLAEAGLTG